MNCSKCCGGDEGAFVAGNVVLDDQYVCTRLRHRVAQLQVVLCDHLRQLMDKTGPEYRKKQFERALGLLQLPITRGIRLRGAVRPHAPSSRLPTAT